MALPSTKEMLARLGATPLNPSGAAFDERIKADRKAWDPILKSVDLSQK